MQNFLAILDFYQTHGLYKSKHDYAEKFWALTFFVDCPCIDIQAIHAYCDKRQKDGVKAATINREINIARSAIGFWNKHKHAQLFNPFLGFRLDEEEFLPRFLSKDECMRLLEVCKCHPNPYFYAYITLLLNTGSRASEILTLEWSCVDMARGIITIKNSLSKSKKTVHKPLNSKALLVLQMLPKENARFVFFNVKTGDRYKTFRKAWINSVDKAGLGYVRLHDLRHTFASLLVEQGVPIYHVSQLLGHSDTRITQRYAHLNNKTLQKAVDLLL